jgi:SAM-dependent methyltransferase
MSRHSAIKQTVGDYYSDKVRTKGATPQGVDWNSVESQEVRFEQLLTVCDFTQPVQINDLGCGYGALADYLARKGVPFSYTGYDISEEMINAARQQHEGADNCRFVLGDALDPCDYTLASGIFNVKHDTTDAEWLEYMLETIRGMDRSSRKGFSFNVLTKYSDPDRMQDYLYYADPCYLFDYCKRHFSRNVALLHDYQLYEFTILVRKT